MSSQLLKISQTAVITATPNQLSSELGGEAIILNMASGVYYGLNEVGARVWELVQQPRSLAELHSMLLEEYDVQPEVCKRDLVKIISMLQDARLVEVSYESH